MKIVNFDLPVTSKWLIEQGHRLDVGPFITGAVEARLQLEKLTVRKDKLHLITKSIFHAGRFGRTWVESEEYGVPFLGSTDILAADLSKLALISKKQVALNSKLIIQVLYSNINVLP